jgi:hypothetical protein
MGTSTTKKSEKLVELTPLLRKAAEKSPVTPDEFMYFKKGIVLDDGSLCKTTQSGWF